MGGFTIKNLDLSALTDLQARLPSTANRAEHTVANQVAKDTVPFVPASGSPAGMYIRTKVKDNTIVYPGPYARYLYYGKLMVDPATGSAWAKKGSIKVVTDKNLVFSKAHHPTPTAHWFEVSKAQNLDKWLDVARKAVARELNK